MVTNKENMKRYSLNKENRAYYKCDWINCFRVAEFFGFPIENKDTIKLCTKHCQKAVAVQMGRGSEKDKKDFRRVLRKYKKVEK